MTWALLKFMVGEDRCSFCGDLFCELWPAMQHQRDLVKLGQSSRRCWPLHALPVVGRRPHVGEPSLHLPEVRLHLVAFVASHDGIDGSHSLAPQTSQSTAPDLWRSGLFVKNTNHAEEERSVSESHRGDFAPVTDPDSSADIKVGQGKRAFHCAREVIDFNVALLWNLLIIPIFVSGN